MSRSVAVVGAGVAGAAVAYRLSAADADLDVTVYERSTGPGGRAATRRRDDCIYDVGANYLTAEDERVQVLVEGPLADVLVPIREPVWTVDADGEIEPGREDGPTKWTAREGIAVLAERLLAAVDATVRYETPVESVVREGSEWNMALTDGAAAGGSRAGSSSPADAVVLTPPAPVTATLLGDVSVAAELREAAAELPFRSIASVACRYEHDVEWPSYALVDVSKSRDLGWVARESCKPGHVPDGEVVLVQASPQWTADHVDEPDDVVAHRTASLLADLLDDPGLADPAWTDVVRWKHALPDEGLPESVRSEPAAAGLHVAGDWVRGEARLYAALRSGVEAADAVLADR